jgi:hypothetical protein
MLSDKWSALRFVVTDPATGRRGPLDPRPYLDERQFEKMSEDPEMILEFCRFLGREIVRAGYSRREIRAVVLCSLNGRKPQLLIDPTVDLTTVRRSFGRQPWIVPLHEPLRAEPWTVPPSEWEKYVDVTPPGRAAP